jgi:hypothetical protein
MSGLAGAATITVDTLADGSVAKHCTLRDAIDAAAAKTAMNHCVAGTGTDTIVFSVTGTITLSRPLPSILNISPDSLTINGKGKAITVDGANLFQVLHVNPGATLYLHKLTIAHGTSFHGGGIENSGILTVSNSTFSGNIGHNGGGIFNGGALTVTNSSFSGSGSGDGSGCGIENSGTVTFTGTATVSNSTFSGNTCYEGGGIYNSGTLTVSNSTFSGNNAVVQNGGGIENDATATVTNSTFSGNSSSSDTGGGISNGFHATLTVTNSTFSGNSAENGGGIGSGGTLTVTNTTFAGNSAASSGGGILNFGGPMTVTNSTFSNNSVALPDTGGPLGAGISNQGTGSVKGTILAGSSGGGNCPEIENDPLSDAGYNISDDNSCGFSGTSVNNSTTLHLDPMGLQNNGGPTQTIALEPNSDALDFIPVASCTDQSSPIPQPLITDQRGFPRPDHENLNFCDAGAFELRCRRRHAASECEHRGGRG